MRISKRIFKDISHRLVDLAKEFGISSEVQHRAMADCEITQKVYEYMKKYCYTNNIDIASLLKTSHGKSFDLKDFKPEVEKFQRKDALQIVTNLGGIPTDLKKESTRRFSEKCGFNSNDKTVFIKWLP